MPYVRNILNFDFTPWQISNGVSFSGTTLVVTRLLRKAVVTAGLAQNVSKILLRISIACIMFTKRGDFICLSCLIQRCCFCGGLIFKKMLRKCFSPNASNVVAVYQSDKLACAIYPQPPPGGLFQLF